MITKEEFETYCKTHNLRYIFNHETQQENWNDSIFLTICLNGYLETAKWYYSLGYTDKYKCKYVFRSCCANGNLEIVRWLYSLYNDMIDDDVFTISCCNGHLQLSKWLFLMNRDMRYDHTFLQVCCYDQLDVAKWLHSIDIKHCINYERGFFSCCRYDSKRITMWFLFDLGFVKEKYLLECCPKCLEVVKYYRKKQLLNGYIYGGGDETKPLSLVSHNNFVECLDMI